VRRIRSRFVKLFPVIAIIAYAKGGSSRFDVEDGCAVDCIKIIHMQYIAFDLDQVDGRDANGVRSLRAAQRKHSPFWAGKIMFGVLPQFIVGL
jgi:hypothetical protein